VEKKKIITTPLGLQWDFFLRRGNQKIRFQVVAAMTIFLDVTVQPRRTCQATSKKKAACCQLLPHYCFGIFFDPEAGGNTFLQNVSELLLHFKASHPRRYYCSLPEYLLTDLYYII
jgi:hypothetical protein